MTTDEIKTRMEEIDTIREALESEVLSLQEQCPHPERKDGFYAFYAMVPAKICTTCGHCLVR